jgi:uncharacterized protein YndB with AHSA1/START domain
MEEKDLILKISTVINASLSKVWTALTDPEMIKQYFFGTECITDWKKGQPIVFRGTWEGKEYEDKGIILDIEKEKLIKYSYWSSFSGTEDKPENYSTITYLVTPEGNSTLFTVIQEGFKNQEAYDHSKGGWEMLLKGLKDLVEKE